jgi:hypothetical protein
VLLPNVENPTSKKITTTNITPIIMEIKEVSTKLDYIIVETGYTSRILQKLANLDDNDYFDEEDKDLLRNYIIIADKLWGKEKCACHINKDHEKLEDLDTLKEFIKTKKLDGIIIFKAVDISTAFQIYNLLKHLDYCAMFGVCGISVYEANNKMIGVLECDTESG